MEAVDFIHVFKANLAKFAWAGGLDPNNGQIPSDPLNFIRRMRTLRFALIIAPAKHI
jgi:hypothetical protein